MSQRSRRDFLLGTGTCATGLVVANTVLGQDPMPMPIPLPISITYIKQNSTSNTQINPDDPDATHYVSFTPGSATTLYISGLNFGSNAVPNDKARPILTGVYCRNGVFYRVDFKINEAGLIVTNTLITVPISNIVVRQTNVTCTSKLEVPSKSLNGHPIRGGDSSITITTVTPGGNYSPHQVFPAVYV